MEFRKNIERSYRNLSDNKLKKNTTTANSSSYVKHQKL